MLSWQWWCLHLQHYLDWIARFHDYVVNVDAQGPSGFGSGSIYLAFTDQSGDTYYLSIYSSTRSVHTVRYNSEKPSITNIYWSDYGFTA